MSNREKSRFVTSFVSLVTHPLTLLPLHEMESLMKDELSQQTPSHDLWEQFSEERKRQFMAMSVYLIPLDQVLQLVGSEFSVLVDLLNRNLVRLDTSDLLGEDEGIVHCDEETDRYVDCWRHVADRYAVSGL
jgi:predicted lipid carrier protein YhbT